jgi:tetratricopeptide (TPR) repeat protein
MRRQTLLCLLLAGITLVLYWPATHYDLIYFDDPVFVTETPEINSGLNWHSLVFAFTSLLAANWHPITNLTFLLTHQFAAPNPGLEHLVNAGFHAANAALLFLLLFRLTGATWRSAATAALFAWHPLRVESVAWIAERKDVMSLFFFLLTLLAYVRYVEKLKNQIIGAKKFFYLSLFLFALGLMSKSMLVTVPFVLLLLDFWPLRRLETVPDTTGSPPGGNTWRRLAWEKWPFFGLTILFSILTYLSQRHGAEVSLDRIDLITRADNIVSSYLRYLGKMIWPQDLALLYPFPYNERAYLALWPDWQLFSATVVLVLISILCIRLKRTHPYLLVGWFWFLGTMLPVIGLIQVGGQGMADRYTYLPLIGPAIALVWLAADLIKPALQKMVLIPISVLVLAACLWSTHQQLKYWRDTISLFNHTIDVTGPNNLAELILGDGLDHAGFSNAALVNYRIATALNPNDKEGFQEIARIMTEKQDWNAAADNYRTVLSLDPNESTAYYGLAQALIQLGQTNEVLDTLKMGVQVAPDSPDLLNNVAWLLATSSEPTLRDGPLAVTLAEHACEITHREQTMMLGTLAAAYAEAGRFNDAISTAMEACKLAAEKGDNTLLQRNQELLGLYQKRQPFHDRENLVPDGK